ncbi:MAG: flagellar biosynthetic protein FliO [Pseudomonadales bacterium]|nr:flagellar biosynthetic protein FliO [Pseudomonadales bacterium]MCP5184758.1 flagellar biosynthetic protein FliO [Pseudomonadales bacterium]
MHADYFQIALALLFIVALIVGLGFVTRRMTGFRPGEGNGIAVVATRYLGPKEKLLLVEVDGTRVLIGVGAQHMTPLARLRSRAAPFAKQLDMALDAASAEETP